jgi:hypothetical protein
VRGNVLDDMQEATITPRMPNIAALAPEALQAILAVAKTAEVNRNTSI